MNDRELLELAAKAAGYEVEYDDIDHRWHIEEREGQHPDQWPRWSPLHDDGDAMRLAVKLDIRFRQHPALVTADYPCFDDAFNERQTICEGVLDDYYAATRRAIVRSAAEIGKKVEAQPEAVG